MSHPLARWIDEHATIWLRRVDRTRRSLPPEYRVVIRARLRPAEAERVCDELGGSITQERTPQGNPRSTVTWEVSGAQAISALRAVAPSLDRQRAMVESILELVTLLDAAPHTATGRPTPPDLLDEYERLYRSTLALCEQLRGNAR